MGDLTAKFIEKAKPGRYADGGGLYLLVKPTGGRFWVLRVQVGGKRRDFGLGSVETRALRDRSDIGNDIPLEQRSKLTLDEARELAARMRNVAKAGGDPSAERKRDKTPPPTFAEAAEATHKALAKGWSDRTADAFLSSLKEHAFPVLGRVRVDAIEAKDIATALYPIWTAKPSIARKVRQRIAKVLDFSKAMHWRGSEAPRKSVATLIGKSVKGGNFAAMPYAEVPAFYADLHGKAETVGRLALMLMLATACRNGEAREARWKHIDWDKREWNRPAALMRKSGEAHTVTLNAPAMEVLRRAAAFCSDSEDPEALIFPNSKGDKLSDMTISKVMRDAGLSYVPHGLRSSFRDWAAEKMPHVPDPVADAALSHTIPDAVVKAYKRTKFLEMRRTLLDAWGRFITSEKGKVVQLAPMRA